MEKQQSKSWEKYKDISSFVTKVSAQVDYSTQYRAEGLTWKCLEGTLRYVDRGIVVAWKEK